MMPAQKKMTKRIVTSVSKGEFCSQHISGHLGVSTCSPICSHCRTDVSSKKLGLDISRLLPANSRVSWGKTSHGWTFSVRVLRKT